MRPFLVACLLLLVAADGALAAPPTLLSVGQQDRHPVAGFAMPGADDAAVSIATSPDRASDGSFLEENVTAFDLLTDAEIQAGSWTYESQIDPGTYYVMVNATDLDCVDEPGCLQGFSNAMPLTIPKPVLRFSSAVTVYRVLSLVDLELTVTPLGESLPYRVCWTRRARPRKCMRGTVVGDDWNSEASDSIEVPKRGMRRRTTFTWYVDGVQVASKRVRIRRRAS
jgi:hypothetical protein